MQNRSNLWKTLAASGNAKMETSLLINGREYTPKGDVTVNRASAQFALSLGNCVTAAVDFSVYPLEGAEIPNASAALVRVRFADGEKKSEWLTAGTFYVSRRQNNSVNGALAFQGYDAMIRADAPYPSLSGFPKAMNSAVMEIARNIGVEIDGRTWTDFPTGPGYYVPLPSEGVTMIKVLGYIGGVCGGNWIITPRGKLRLVPLVSASGAASASDKAEIVAVMTGIVTGDAVTVTGAEALNGSTRLFAGSDTGGIVSVPANPYITQTALNALLTRYGGLSYAPYEIRGGVYDPATEIGDYLVSREDVASIIWQEKANYAPMFRGDLSAPFLSETSGTERSVSDAISESGGVSQDLSVRFYKFVNAGAVTVGDGQSAEIINFDYAAGSGQDVIFHAEIRHTTETTETGNAVDGWTCTDAVLTVTYYINGTAVTSYHPVKAETDGENLLHLNYHFENGKFTTGNFRAALELSGGSVTIAAGDARACIIGQGYVEGMGDWIAEDGLVFVGVESYPDKMDYVTGDTLDLTGLVVNAYYGDGTEKNVTAQCVIAPAHGDALEEGETVVNISYTEDGKEYRDSFSVYCESDGYDVLFIEVLTPPTKTSYLAGETLNLNGLVIGAVQENGWIVQNIKPACTFSPAEGDTLTGEGPLTVTVTKRYSELLGGGTFTTYFEVDIERVGITAYPENTEYIIGDTLDYTGLEITEVLPDGTWRDITSECTFAPEAGTEVTEAGPISVTINYNGEEVATFKVETASAIASGDGWTLYSNGLLDIYRKGGTPGGSPWSTYSRYVREIILRDSVTTVSGYSFEDLINLTSVTIPDSVTKIGSSAFWNCKSLTSVTIPNSVTSIEGDAFRNCSALTSVTIPDGIAKIEGYTFLNCGSLTSVTIPDSVTKIGSSAFSGCTSLRNIAIPSGVQQIQESAFSGCTSLTSIIIPSSVTYIGSGIFSGCTALTSVVLPDGIDNIWSNAFDGCGSLVNITIPGSVGSYAFRGCTSLTSVTVPRYVKYDGKYYIGMSIGFCAFEDCTSLTRVRLLRNVTAIGKYAFRGCTSLATIAFTEGMYRIEAGAFDGCTALTDVYYSGSIAEWNRINIESDNTALTSATIHYNSSGPS